MKQAINSKRIMEKCHFVFSYNVHIKKIKHQYNFSEKGIWYRCTLLLYNFACKNDIALEN